MTVSEVEQCWFFSTVAPPVLRNLFFLTSKIKPWTVICLLHSLINFHIIWCWLLWSIHLNSHCWFRRHPFNLPLCIVLKLLFSHFLSLRSEKLRYSSSLLVRLDVHLPLEPLLLNLFTVTLLLPFLPILTILFFLPSQPIL